MFAGRRSAFGVLQGVRKLCSVRDGRTPSIGSIFSYPSRTPAPLIGRTTSRVEELRIGFLSSGRRRGRTILPQSEVQTQRRGISTFPRSALEELELLADENPQNGAIQAEYLRELGHDDPQSVVRRVESDRFAINSDCLAEYVKALEATRRLDSSKLRNVGRAFEERAAANSNSAAAAKAPGSGTFSSRGSSPARGSTPLAPPAPQDGPRPFSVSGNETPGSEEKPIEVVMLPAPRHFLGTFLVIASLGILVWSFVKSGGFKEWLKGRKAGGSDEALEIEKPTATFADVQGVEEAKEDLMEIVEFLRRPQDFVRLGGKLPKGVLLVGSPGTGKTLMARAIAGEAGVHFLPCSGADFEEMFVGLGARRIRALFEKARRVGGPCIIFIDEIDAIGGRRNPKDSQTMRQSLNQLLTEMDGFKQTSAIVVIAATNTPDALDPALIRPGRFDRTITVPNPDLIGRIKILELYMGKIKASKDVNVELLARGTPDMTGADLANLVNTATLRAGREGRVEVTPEDLEFAKDKIQMGAPSKFNYSEKVRKLTAYHETGHALVAFFTPGAQPLHKLTVVPRGALGALGLTVTLPENDDPSWSVDQLKARIDVCMGGRMAEELIYGNDGITHGASNDFRQATAVAQVMVRNYGMSEAVGPVFLPRDKELSPQMQKLVDQEISRLLEESKLRVRKLLESHKTLLHRVTAALLERETLDMDDVKTLVSNGKLPPLAVKLAQATAKPTSFRTKV